MATKEQFYNSIKKDARKLIKDYGGKCTITADEIITKLNSQQIVKRIFEKEILYVAKPFKNFLIQDRFYESAEVSILIPADSYEYVDKYKYRAIIQGQSYEIIRHRSITPGPIEALIELALRKPGTGEKK